MFPENQYRSESSTMHFKTDNDPPPPMWAKKRMRTLLAAV